MSLTVTATICGHPVAGAEHHPCTEAPGHGSLEHDVEHRHDGAYCIERKTATDAQTPGRLAEALARLNEPPFGHHIKGRPRDGEWHCTCGYGAEDDHFDSAEEHIAKVVISVRE